MLPGEPGTRLDSGGWVVVVVVVVVLCCGVVVVVKWWWCVAGVRQVINFLPQVPPALRTYHRNYNCLALVSTHNRLLELNLFSRLCTVVIRINVTRL